MNLYNNKLYIYCGYEFSTFDIETNRFSYPYTLGYKPFMHGHTSTLIPGNKLLMIGIEGCYSLNLKELRF